MFDTLTFEGLRMRYFAADWKLFRPPDVRISEAKLDSTPLACVAGPSRLGISPPPWGNHLSCRKGRGRRSCIGSCPGSS